MDSHDFGATLQYGIVDAVDEKSHAVVCRLPALEDIRTDWLPVLTPAAGGNRFYSLPDTGELVICLLDARGEGGVVLGAVYNDEDRPPVSDRNIWMRRFANGTVISHNRQTGEVSVKTSGQVKVKAKKVHIDAPDTEITGTAKILGHLTYTAGMSASAGAGGGAAASIEGTAEVNGDIVLNGISLKNFVENHVHPDLTSGGNTGSPIIKGG